MSIETFTKEQFETYLSQSHSPFESLGLVDGEYAYKLPLDGQSAIMLRSSIKSDGISASTGKDSIRAWLIDLSKTVKRGGEPDSISACLVGSDGIPHIDFPPLGSKVHKWITRQSGWEDRLTQAIKILCEWRSIVGDCPDCHKPKSIYKSKTTSNKGRIFAKCRECDKYFIWLDEITQEDKNNVYFSKASHNGNIGNVGEVAYQESDGESNSMRLADTDNGNTGNGESARETSESREVPVVSQPSEPEAKIAREPNSEQRQVIEAPIDANVRVLAPPGSGKTFVIEHRYNYLVQNGVDPKKVLVMTFSKAMADEMAERISKTCPQAEKEQISTIHALCYRLLCKWDISSPYFKWEVPKDWRVRKELEDIIGQIWSYGEKPGYSEVLNYIDTSKYLGLTVDESYEWFCGVLGNQYGEWLYEIRSRFDAWLQRNRSLTFTDMLYLTEQKLKKDKTWRDELQRKFSYVICDEGQDTNYQAMRILITISLEPGQNTVYESEVR